MADRTATPTKPREPSSRPLLLTRQEAAEQLSMSVRHFERHVQPHVPCVYSGQLRLYRPRDLERWIDENLDEGQAAA